jgi:excisionase family DNA binding protein
MQRSSTGKALTHTAAEAAHALGISRNSIYELLRRGELRSVRLGRRLVIPRSAVDELVGAREPAPLPSSGPPKQDETFESLTPYAIALANLMRQMHHMTPCPHCHGLGFTLAK